MTTIGGRMVEVILFIVAFVLLVAAVLIYMSVESNDYAKAHKELQGISSQVSRISEQNEQWQKATADTMQSSIDILKDEIEMLKTMPPQTTHHKHKVEVTPVTIIMKNHKEAPKGQGVNALLPRGESLMGRAGFKKRKPEVTQ